jgi:hypothetical protein
MLDKTDRRRLVTHATGALAALAALGPNNIVTDVQRDIFMAQAELAVGYILCLN